MSDYDPNLGPGRLGYDPKDPYRAPDDGRPGYILLAVLAGVALVGGFLYFGNPQNSTGPEQAQAPIERTVTETPMTPGATNPDRPASIPMPATPAPAAPQAAPQE
ncbi:hypothetical protein [uncultured Reyranella sp.]|jgi:hypothetical protein|uniref:hypothetical protein n=1 Tax=uncultured Reyranella sp. TaxID=735512 RepID=UPI00259CD7A9|nr:hypothetical protein [uncultured Reyranella sp.]